MTATFRSVLTGVLVIAALTATVYAKGTTIKLTVTGAGLAQPLDVVDPQLLAASNVWEGAFLGTASVEPDASLPRYSVVFIVDPPQWMKQKPAARYAVVYAKNPRTGEGFIYLPGKGEDGYRLNVGTMMRDGQDGRWLSASSGWARALNRHLP